MSFQPFATSANKPIPFLEPPDTLLARANADFPVISPYDSPFNGVPYSNQFIGLNKDAKFYVNAVSIGEEVRTKTVTGKNFFDDGAFTLELPRSGGPAIRQSVEKDALVSKEMSILLLALLGIFLVSKRSK